MYDRFAASIDAIAMKRLYAVFLLVVGVYIPDRPREHAPQPRRDRAKLVPPGAVGGTADPQVVH
jgi:hypothetical protein